MSGYAVRKKCRIAGDEYAAGDPLDLDTLPTDLRRRLLDQRRVVPLGGGASAGSDGKGKRRSSKRTKKED